jgi:malic enzyme
VRALQCSTGLIVADNEICDEYKRELAGQRAASGAGLGNADRRCSPMSSRTSGSPVLIGASGQAGSFPEDLSARRGASRTPRHFRHPTPTIIRARPEDIVRWTGPLIVAAGVRFNRWNTAAHGAGSDR